MAIVPNVCNGNSRAANACLAVENSRIGRDVLAKGSRELDEPLSSLERRDDLGQPRVEAAQQLACIALLGGTGEHETTLGRKKRLAS
jgi:hypothetical protein